MLAVSEINKSWTLLAPYVDAYKTKRQYNEAKKLLRDLMQLKKDDRTIEIKSFAKILAKTVSNYEKHTFGFSAKNHAKPKDILNYLMQEHGLKQADLPELGSQSYVSRILKGERELTIGHIKLLSSRFNISPSTFF